MLQPRRPTHGLLAAAKSMETSIRYLAAELGPSGVTAVGVLPGFIDTDSMPIMTGPLYETMKKVEVETHPLREAASPEAAAEAIALMCLPEAGWLNGQERPERRRWSLRDAGPLLACCRPCPW